MAAELDKLSQYYSEKGNSARAAFYAALASEERASKTPETFSPSIILEETQFDQDSRLDTDQVRMFFQEKFRFYYQSTNRRLHEIVLPKPPPEYAEMHHIFNSEGFQMEPMVYVTEDDIIYALIDTRVRPDKDDVLTTTSTDDGYVPILKKGRQDGKIDTKYWPKKRYPDNSPYWNIRMEVPDDSRFGLTWHEVHEYVVPEVISVSSQMTQLVERTGIKLRVPTQQHFLMSGGIMYPHFGKSRSYEWLYDKAYKDSGFLFGFPDSNNSHLIGGNGDLYSTESLDTNKRRADVGFRLEALCSTQKFR